MFQSLPYYRQAASQRAVLRFLKSCLQNETFLKALAGAIVRLGPRRYIQLPTSQLQSSKTYLVVFVIVNLSYNGSWDLRSTLGG